MKDYGNSQTAVLIRIEMPKSLHQAAVDLANQIGMDVRDFLSYVAKTALHRSDFSLNGSLPERGETVLVSFKVSQDLRDRVWGKSVQLGFGFIGLVLAVLDHDLRDAQCVDAYLGGGTTVVD